MSVSAVSRRRQRAVHLHEVPAPDAPSRLWLVALGVVVGIGALYHWLQSRGHVTPAVFTDELLFSELARSFAAGDLFQVRGEHVFFPAFLPALLQAPAWLVHSTPLAYAIAKGLNTLLMCSAALPAYWLARQLVRPAFALVVAAATLAGGGMVYHGYLTSEAAAYPVFLLAVAVSVRALAAPSRGRDLMAVAVLGLAVLTRAQFVVLPIAFALAVLLVGRPLRRHAAALLALATGAILGLAVGGPLLGFYAGAGELDYGVAETLRWSAWTAALLPFGAGLLVVPGALLGIGFALRRSAAPGERAFAALTALLLALMPLQAGLIGSGSAHKPMERYAFYLLPLVFLAFFVFAERGVNVRLHGGVALALAGVALVTPVASLTVDPYSFDSPTLSAVETLGRWTSHGDAAALFGAAGVLGALTAVGLRRRPTLTALLSVGLALLIGLGAYSGDRRMTHRTLEALAPTQPDWLERSGVHEADVLALPGGSLHRGWVLESWNRNVGRTFHLGDVPADQLPYTVVGIRPDGRVAPVGRRLLRSNYLVVDDSGTQIELNARRIARPRAGLSLYRLSRPLQLGSVAFGLYSDGWGQSVLGYRVFRRGDGGSYRITLSLPKGRAARTVDAEAGPVRRFATLRPGSRLTLRIPVSSGLPPELAIRVGRADLIEAETPRPRLVAARIEALDFVPKGSRK